MNKPTKKFIPKVRGFDELRPYIQILTGQTNLADHKAQKYLRVDSIVKEGEKYIFIHRLEIPYIIYTKNKQEIDRLENLC
jgi:hypothetical protein